jgi:hypothetical protein
MRTNALVSFGGVCAGSFLFAGWVAASDARLDLADENISKAIALVEAAEAGPEDRKFEKDRFETTKKLCGALEVIARMRGQPFSPSEGDPCFEFTLK